MTPQRALSVLLFILVLAACGGSDEDAGRSLFATGRYREAIAPLRAALAERPDAADLNRLLGASLLAIGRPSMAIFPLAKAAEHPEQQIEAGLLLARALLRTGVGVDAITATSKVLEADPDNLVALTLRARALLMEKQESLALEAIDRARELAPSDAQLPLMRLEALLQLGRIDEAGESIAEARQLAEQSDPPDTSGAAHFCSVQISFLHERGDDETAEATLEDCLERYPESLQVLDAGTEFFDELRRPDRSTELLRDAHESNPESLAVRVAYANRLARRGERAHGEALIREALEEQPTAWLALLDFAVDMNDPALGLEAAEGALAVHPNPPPGLALMRVDFLIRLGDPRAEEAVEALEYEVHRLAGRGRLQFERGEPARALETLEDAIRLWPDNAMARYLAGLAAEQLGDFDRAISEYRESTRLDPTHTDAAYQLASLHASRGEYPAASHAIAHYLKSRPSDAEGLVLRLRISNALGEEQLTRTTLARLAAMPGGSDLGLSVIAQEMRSRAGAEAAIEVLESTGLDFTDPEFALALAELTDALVAAGRSEDALRLAEIAGTEHPADGDLQAVRGAVLEKLGRHDEARAAYRVALHRDPSVVRAISGLGRIAEGEGKPEQALSFFGRASREQPDVPEHLVDVARMERQLGREEDAAKRLEDTLRRHPRSGAVASARALQLLESGGDPERAWDLARRGVVFGASAQSYAALGRVMVARGDTQGAIRAFRRAAALDPQSGAVEALRSIQPGG